MVWPKGKKRLGITLGRRTTLATGQTNGGRQDNTGLGAPVTATAAATSASPSQLNTPSHDLQNANAQNPANQLSQTWKRVGPRELAAILEPWAFDHSSSENENGNGSGSGSDQDERGAVKFNTTKGTAGKEKECDSPAGKTPRTERALRRAFLRTNSLFGNKDNIVSTALEMSSQQGKWREEQVLIICPGSHTTMAQLGCSELTPPAQRIPTRMFKDHDTDDYIPYYTFKRKKEGTNGFADGQANNSNYEYVEDRDSVEGAIYPIQGGRIVNMEAFLAFLDHVHSLLTTTYHNTPIVLMASPQWTRPDCESISRYIFEKTKTPALCLLHSAVAAQYGLKWPTMTVVDIGFEKVDVTCIHDNVIVSHKDLGYPAPERDISGGEVFTQKLLSLLKGKSFTHDMAEQLKKSPLCEVLPYASEHPQLMELPTEGAATVGQAGVVAEAPKLNEPLKSAAALPVGAEDDDSIPEKADEDGVLDVAVIVTTGDPRQFIAKKEKEKAEKAKSKKGKAAQEAEAAAAKPVRLPNSRRINNIFHYEELAHDDVQVTVSNGAPKPAAPAPLNGGATAAEGSVKNGDTVTAPANGETSNDALPFAAEVAGSITERRTKCVRRDVEVGLERFLFADRGEIDRITDTIYRAIQSIDEIYKRSGCWDNIVFVGNGSRLRGLKENIMQTLNARHLISPSSATIFTSELPSNVATPTGTGSQTPLGSFAGQIPTTSSVNPLLQAATTASLNVPGQIPNAPGSTLAEAGPSHHSHAQTPTSIKTAALPTYLAEWTKNGFEEAMFLGSLVAARLAYCIHNLDAQGAESQRMMSLNRVDYNEFGPKSIRTHSMLGP